MMKRHDSELTKSYPPKVPSPPPPSPETPEIQTYDIIAKRLTKEAEQSLLDILNSGHPLEKRTTSLTFSSTVSSLFESGEFSDVNIIHNGVVCPVHRVFLAASSPVFACMLNGKWSSEDVVLKDCCSTLVFRTFLHYFYGYNVVIDHSNVVWLLLLANKYQVDPLKKECISLMETNLMNVRCIASIIQLSEILDLQELRKKAIQFACFHMNEIIDNGFFPNFDIKLLEHLLQRTDLVISSELKLLKAILEQRLPEDHKILVPFIRFPLISPRQLCNIENMEVPGINVRDLLFEAYKYHSLPKDLQVVNFKNNTQVVRRNYSDFIWRIRKDPQISFLFFPSSPPIQQRSPDFFIEKNVFCVIIEHHLNTTTIAIKPVSSNFIPVTVTWTISLNNQLNPFRSILKESTHLFTTTTPAGAVFLNHKIDKYPDDGWVVDDHLVIEVKNSSIKDVSVLFSN